MISFLMVIAFALNGTQVNGNSEQSDGYQVSTALPISLVYDPLSHAIQLHIVYGGCSRAKQKHKLVLAKECDSSTSTFCDAILMGPHEPNKSFDCLKQQGETVELKLKDNFDKSGIIVSTSDQIMRFVVNRQYIDPPPVQKLDRNQCF